MPEFIQNFKNRSAERLLEESFSTLALALPGSPESDNESPTPRVRQVEVRLAKYCLLLCALSDFDTRRPTDGSTTPISTTFHRGFVPRVLDDDEKTYRKFLDSLADVCSIGRGPRMVTAIVVEQAEDGTVFHVTRNSTYANVDFKSEQQDLLEFLTTLLGGIRDIGEVDDGVFLTSAKCKELLHHVVDHCNEKLKFYRKQLIKYIEECNQSELRHRASPQTLLELANLSIKASGKHKRIAQLKELVLLAKDLSKSLFPFVDELGVKLESPAHKCWKELRHYVARFACYNNHFKIFCQARRRFPDLFKSFKVHFLVPLPPRAVAAMWSFEDVQRFIRDATEGTAHEWSLETIRQVHKKMKALSKETRKGFRRTIHAEVTLANWFWFTKLKDKTTRSRVRPKGKASKDEILLHNCFRSYDYIGTSKPACPLCRDYLFHRPISELVRSHPNVYPRWAPPGFEYCADAVDVKDLKDSLRWMEGILRFYVLSILIGRAPEKTPRCHDSDDEL